MGNKKISLLSSLALPILAGAIGSFFTFDAISTWYRFLNKPAFSPPNWVFGPVWTLLYVMMGVAFYLFLISSKGRKTKENGFKFYFIQLILNALWSIIFFGLKLPYVSFLEIMFLWFFIFLTIREFKKVSTAAGILLVPYLVWVSFATILNFFIVLLN